MYFFNLNNDVNIQLLRGLIKFKFFFLKVGYEGELQISESKLFHSTNVDGKKRIKEKVILYCKLGNDQVLTISCLV